MDKNHLHILWTNADPVTAEKMVFMYGINALRNRWWEKLTVIIWGAPTQLVGTDPDIQEQVRQALAAGVKLTACKACADQLGVTETLEKLGVEVKYWGVPLTDLIKGNENLLTI